MSEQDRIDFLSLIEKDKNKVTISLVQDLFRGTIAHLDSSTNTFKNVKEKLGEDQYIRLMTSLCNSFLSTLYINGAKNEKEQKERLKLVNEMNKDLIKYEKIIEEKK